MDAMKILEKTKERLILAEEVSLHLSLFHPKEQEFARNLLSYLTESSTLSVAQWFHMERLANQIKVLTDPSQQMTVEGNFNGTLVMLRIAGEKLKRPLIRLLSDPEEGRPQGYFFTLKFRPERPSDGVTIVVGGWSGHGQAYVAGWIRDGRFQPHARNGGAPRPVLDKIQEFSKDPAQVMKASAAALGVCGFCLQTLSDPESKARGYGPICAENYGLPWGKVTEEVREKVQKIRTMDLNELF